MKPVRFHPEAEAEMIDAAAWSDVIEVIAVMHLRREPGYWAKRRAELG